MSVKCSAGGARDDHFRVRITSRRHFDFHDRFVGRILIGSRKHFKIDVSRVNANPILSITTRNFFLVTEITVASLFINTPLVIATLLFGVIFRDTTSILSYSSRNLLIVSISRSLTMAGLPSQYTKFTTPLVIRTEVFSSSLTRTKRYDLNKGSSTILTRSLHLREILFNGQ